MLAVRPIDTRNSSDRRQFLRFPFALYRDHALWVPPIRPDAELQLDRDRHPFYEHSDADFFVAERGGKVVGRIAALENRPYNAYHRTHTAQFYLFECIDDRDAAAALFERVFKWARARGLNKIVGPKGFGPLDGYGILVEGFEHRPAMTMMNYNPLSDREVDFVAQNALILADPKLIKLIVHGDDIVGFLFGFPDVSAALQRCGGNVYSWHIVDLLLEFRRTKWMAINGAGVLPEYQGRGGNALLYTEMEKAVRGSRFDHADLTQVAETAAQMRQDLVNLGARPYKNHRVYGRNL